MSKLLIFMLILIVFIVVSPTFINQNVEKTLADKEVHNLKERIANDLNVNASEYKVYFVDTCFLCLASISKAKKEISIKTGEDVKQKLKHEVAHLKYGYVSYTILILLILLIAYNHVKNKLKFTKNFWILYIITILVLITTSRELYSNFYAQEWLSLGLNVFIIILIFFTMTRIMRK